MGFDDERTIVAGLIIATLFLYLNVSPDVGTIFAMMSLTYMVTVFTNSFPRIEIIKGILNLSESVGVAGVAFVAWVIIASFSLQYMQPALQLTSVFDLDFFKALSAQTQIPILSSDPLIRLLTYGVIIPVIETLFFLSFALVFWAKVLRKPLDFNPRTMWIVAVLVGMTGSLFHLTVRIASNYALFVDFLFFTLSAFMVLKYRDMIKPMLLHIMVNTSVLLSGVVR